MNLLLTLIIGFSVVSSVVLFVTYVWFLNNVNRSPYALFMCACLLISLAVLQLNHLGYIGGGVEPLSRASYLVALFLCPAMFYLFSRAILFEERHVRRLDLLHLVPLLLLWSLPQAMALALLFCIGTGYSLWLTHVIYTLQSSRQRSRFELFFLMIFSIMALGVLLLGFALPYMAPDYFYNFYTLAIGVAMILVVGVLLAFPELLSELAQVAKQSYAASTLTDIDVAAKQHQLEQLMLQDQLYRQDDLNLADVAAALALSPHQLSELINTQFAMSFSRYVRKHRVNEALRLLTSQPDASVLSISLEVGFKSQSNFYVAFKEVTGESPGAYRKRLRNVPE